MGESAKKQNYCLNFVKGCACLGVLHMHTSYDCLISSIITCLVRFGVLIFFMISGYYCFDDDLGIVQKKLPIKCKHIVRLCIFSTLIYFAFAEIVTPLLSQGKIALFSGLQEYTTVDNIINFVVFNQVPFGGVLWFLFALLYCYFLVGIVNKYNCYEKAYVISCLLIAIHIITRGIIQYRGLIPEDINVNFYRNFIFMGFPFFMLGNYMHRYQESIVHKFTNRKLILIIGVGLVLSCIERYFVAIELYWGTVLVTVCIFIYAVKNQDKKVIPFLSTIGEKYSMPIYILHPLISNLLYYVKCEFYLQDNMVLSILNPIIVLVLILLLAKGYENTKQILHSRNHQ